MSAAPANLDPECWKTALRNFVLLATLLLCPFPLKASDEAKVAALKKWYAEISAQMRASDPSASLGILSRMLVETPEFSVLFGGGASAWPEPNDAREIHASAFSGVPAFHAAVGGAPWLWAELAEYSSAAAPGGVARGASGGLAQGRRSAFVLADRLGIWAPDLARAPGGAA